MGTSASSSSRYLFSLTWPMSGYLLQTTRFRGPSAQSAGGHPWLQDACPRLLGRRSPIPSQIPASVLTMMSQQLAILATRVQELQHNPHFSTVTRHAADHPGEHFLHYAFYKVTMKCDIFILRILIYDLKYFTILRLQNRFTASVLML